MTYILFLHIVHLKFKTILPWQFIRCFLKFDGSAFLKFPLHFLQERPKLVVSCCFSTCLFKASFLVNSSWQYLQLIRISLWYRCLCAPSPFLLLNDFSHWPHLNASFDIWSLFFRCFKNVFLVFWGFSTFLTKFNINWLSSHLH